MKTEQIIRNSNAFLRIRKIEELSEILGENPVFLKTIALNPRYSVFSIPKKNGENRLIEAPANNLKKIQEKLNRSLQCVYYLLKPEYIHGFTIRQDESKVPSGIFANAEMHISKKKVMTFDIKDYFQSFSAKDVWDLFRASPFNFSEPLANLLAMLATWYDILPTGAPTSPVLSNFLTTGLDRKLSVYAASCDSVYSRYADDLTFSFDSFIPERVIKNIKEIIRSEGFNINDRKFRIMSSGERQNVTGLTVNNKVNNSRKYIRLLRAVLFDWKVNGIERASVKYYNLDFSADNTMQTHFRNSVRGRIQFVGNIRGKNDIVYRRLYNQFKSISAH